MSPLVILDTTHILSLCYTHTHTNMAWKSVMSSTSHHALFLCSEVSEANGNSSFSPSPSLPTFILSFLLSFSPHPPSPHCGAALICIEEAPHHHPVSFLPPSFLLFSPLLVFTLVHSHHSNPVCLISSIFQISSSPLVIPFSHRMRIGLRLAARRWHPPGLPSVLPPSLHRYPLYRSINLHFLHSIAPLQHPIVNQKQSWLPLSPLQPTHPPTLQLPTGPGWLIFLRRSVSNWPPWC